MKNRKAIATSAAGALVLGFVYLVLLRCPAHSHRALPWQSSDHLPNAPSAHSCALSRHTPNLPLRLLDIATSASGGAGGGVVFPLLLRCPSQSASPFPHNPNTLKQL